MQPRLNRSSTDVMLAGVCGGLGEYFSIDPVIVRLIFVLVTLTSGLGLPVYIVLWLLMPKGGASSQQPIQQNAQEFSEKAARFGQQIGQEAARLGQQIGQEASQLGREAREVLVAQRRPGAQQSRSAAEPGLFSQQPPAPSEYRFDPLTGQPIEQEGPAVGQTMNLRIDTPELPSQYTPSPVAPLRAAPPRRVRNWSSLGVILIGIGGLILLEQLGINMTFIFPAILIVAGVIMLARRR